jgi:hypothetical protein
MTENLIETVAEAAFAATRRAPWSDVDPEVKPLLLIEAKAAMLATLDWLGEDDIPSATLTWGEGDVLLTVREWLLSKRAEIESAA